jgi:hypothetical protein
MEFLYFVNVTDEDAYPVYVAAEPLSSGASAACSHRWRAIVVSPTVPRAERQGHINAAVASSLPSYPQPRPSRTRRRRRD